LINNDDSEKLALPWRQILRQDQNKILNILIFMQKKQ